DEYALELERADAVVGGLEHIVHAPDVSEIALKVTPGDIAAVIVAIAHGARCALGIVQVTPHQPERPLREIETNLSLLCQAARGIEQHHGKPGKWPPHRPGLHRLCRGISDLSCGFGLSKAIPDGDSPGIAHLRDDLGVQGLPGTHRLAQADAPLLEVALDEHAPYGRGRTEGSDATLHQLGEECPGIEALVLIGK